ncbi:hypothetical protein B0T21DRAFT_372885, partial [Apiosordaria backusii]
MTRGYKYLLISSNPSLFSSFIVFFINSSPLGNPIAEVLYTGIAAYIFRIHSPRTLTILRLHVACLSS